MEEPILICYGYESCISESGHEPVTRVHSILIAPDARGQGSATAVTAALVTTLCEQHYTLIVLNVFADNHPAFRLYQRLGFQTHHTLFTGKAFLVP